MFGEPNTIYAVVNAGERGAVWGPLRCLALATIRVELLRDGRDGGTQSERVYGDSDDTSGQKRWKMTEDE
jgi:hypothetical protein